MIKPKGLVYFVNKKIELVPTAAEQSAEYAVPRLLHHPVHLEDTLSKRLKVPRDH